MSDGPVRDPDRVDEPQRGWTCGCGHNSYDHNESWDVPEGSGLGCDLCDCQNLGTF